MGYLHITTTKENKTKGSHKIEFTTNKILAQFVRFGLGVLNGF